MSDVTRVLVVAGRAIDEQELSRQLDAEELEIKVVAPTVPESRLDLYTGDVDGSIAAAERRAGRSAQSAEAGADATVSAAEAGEADPLLAVEDALATFDADQIVLVPPAAEQPTWAEEGLLEKARERFAVPVRELEAGGA